MSEHQSQGSSVEGPGSIIGERFEVISVPGRGAAGSIYRVRDQQQDGREVALKILRDTSAFDENTLRRFFEEIKVCQQIRHENIVEAYEYIKLPEAISAAVHFGSQQTGKPAA